MDLAIPNAIYGLGNTITDKLIVIYPNSGFPYLTYKTSRNLFVHGCNEKPALVSISIIIYFGGILNFLVVQSFQMLILVYVENFQFVCL